MPSADNARSKQEQKSGQREDASQPTPLSAQLAQSELLFIQRWVASAASAGDSGTPGGPGGSASPMERHIDHLQRSAGNAAVAAALQRDGPEPPASAEQPSQAASDQVQAVLDQIAPVITRARETPDAEVIASTTAPDSATGMLEQAVSRLWRHQRIPFLGAVRRAAAADPTGAHFVQSGPTGGDEQYGQRWSLNFLAANYRNLPQLPEIRALLRRGSPYREAQEAEFSRVIPLDDPTGAQIREALVSTITDLSLALRPGEIGQLMVTYSGHGRGGIMCGVDGPAPAAQVPPEWLMERARFAATLGVQITYVLDTCHAGRLAQFAQRMAADRMQASLDSLPPSRRSEVQPLLAFRAEVADATEAMSDRTIDIILAQRALGHGRRPDGTSRSSGIPVRDELRLAVIESVQALAGANERLSRALRSRPANAPDADQLSAAADRLGWQLLPALSGAQQLIDGAFRQEALTLDLASDYMTQLLTLIRSEANPAHARLAA